MVLAKNMIYQQNQGLAQLHSSSNQAATHNSHNVNNRRTEQNSTQNSNGKTNLSKSMVVTNIKKNSLGLHTNNQIANQRQGGSIGANLRNGNSNTNEHTMGSREAVGGAALQQ